MSGENSKPALTRDNVLSRWEGQTITYTTDSGETKKSDLKGALEQCQFLRGLDPATLDGVIEATMTDEPGSGATQG